MSTGSARAEAVTPVGGAQEHDYHTLGPRMPLSGP